MEGGTLFSGMQMYPAMCPWASVTHGHIQRLHQVYTPYSALAEERPLIQRCQ